MFTDEELSEYLITAKVDYPPYFFKDILRGDLKMIVEHKSTKISKNDFIIITETDVSEDTNRELIVKITHTYPFDDVVILSFEIIKGSSI